MAKKKSSKKRNSSNKQTQPDNTNQHAAATKTAVKSKKAARAEMKARETRMKQIRVIGIVVLVLGAFFGIARFRNAGAISTAELIATYGITIDGSEEAPIRVVEYGDLACSACRQWHNLGIKEQLKQEFGDQVAFEYRHFAVITATSPKGAEASQCAHEQNAFWEFHDYVYENLEAYPNLGSDRSKEIASTIGLDREAFDSCLDSGKYRRFVTDAINQAQSDGARGTPTFMINGRQVSPTFQSMASAIQEELN